MAANFFCPKCRQAYPFTPQIAGRQIRCSQCGEIFTAPTVVAIPVSMAPQGFAPPVADEAVDLDVVLTPLDTAAPAGSPFVAPVVRTAQEQAMLRVGQVLVGLAVVGLWLVVPLLASGSIGKALLLLLLGFGGASLVLYALRQEIVKAATAAGVIFVVLLIGAVLSTRSPDDSPAPNPAPGNDVPVANSTSPTPVAATPQTTAPAPGVSASPAEPKPAAAPNYAGFPARVKRSKMVGGKRDGSPYESSVSRNPIVGFVCQPGQRDGESGFSRIDPIRLGNRASGTQAVMAKEGYAVGGINVDGGEIFHGMQVIFMRLVPDGRLDPADSYTSDWIGTPSGEIQSIASQGPSVVGLFGLRITLCHSVGLVINAEGKGEMAFTEKTLPAVTASASSPSEKGTPLADSTEPSSSDQQPESEPATDFSPADKPTSPAQAMKSVVLVEHPWARAQGSRLLRTWWRPTLTLWMALSRMRSRSRPEPRVRLHAGSCASFTSIGHETFACWRSTPSCRRWPYAAIMSSTPAMKCF